MALVGGDFDVILLVRAADNAALRHVVLDQLQEIPGVLVQPHVPDLRGHREPLTGVERRHGREPVGIRGRRPRCRR